MSGILAKGVKPHLFSFGLIVDDNGLSLFVKELNHNCNQE